MPDKTKMAYFQMVLPSKWNSHKIKPICLHLAGTGDHVCSITAYCIMIFQSIQYGIPLFLQRYLYILLIN